MKRLMILGGVAALALSAFAAKPASADRLHFGISFGDAPYVAPYAPYPAYPPYPAYAPYPAYPYDYYAPSTTYVVPEYRIGGRDWDRGHWDRHDRGDHGYRGHGRRR